MQEHDSRRGAYPAMRVGWVTSTRAERQLRAAETVRVTAQRVLPER